MRLLNPPVIDDDSSLRYISPIHIIMEFIFISISQFKHYYHLLHKMQLIIKFIIRFLYIYLPIYLTHQSPDEFLFCIVAVFTMTSERTID